MNRVSRSNNEEIAVDTHLMQMALNPKRPENRCTIQPELANDVTSPRKACKNEGKENEESKKQETEVLSEKGEMSKIT